MISATVRLSRPTEDGSRALGISFALAAALHVGVALGSYRHPKPAVVPLVTEIVLAPPVTEPEPPPPPTELPVVPLPATKAPAAASPVARAGALLTRRDDAPSKPADEPADFVTDPNGSSYGSGVVARGGTADIGLPSAATGAPHPAASRSGAVPPGDPIARASDLSRTARLTARDPCRGRYPRDARADMADVTLSLVVGANGELRRATVLSEAPAGQGFGEAARACVTAQRLEPALSQAGTPVTSVTTLVVHFSR